LSLIQPYFYLNLVFQHLFWWRVRFLSLFPFFSFFALACAVVHAVSALPVPWTDAPEYGLSARDDLEARSTDFEVLEERAKGSSRKYTPPRPPTVTFEKGVSKHSAQDSLKNLGLQGKKRKAVENYHTRVVQNHMKTVPGAKSAVIKNLAHDVGTRDRRMHVSAVIKGKDGQPITAPRRGNPAIRDPTHHIYVNKKSLPRAMTRAADRKANREASMVGSKRTARKAKQEAKRAQPTNKRQSGRKPNRRG